MYAGFREDVLASSKKTLIIMAEVPLTTLTAAVESHTGRS